MVLLDFVWVRCSSCVVCLLSCVAMCCLCICTSLFAVVFRCVFVCCLMLLLFAVVGCELLALFVECWLLSLRVVWLCAVACCCCG